MQVGGLGVDVQQAGDYFAAGVALLDQVHRRDAVARVVIGVALAQAQYRAVVLFDVHGLAGVVVDRDLHARPAHAERSEQRRVGTDRVSSCKSQWSPSHSKNTRYKYSL